MAGPVVVADRGYHFSRAPEGITKAESIENLSDLGTHWPTRFGRQAIGVPRYSKLPQLVETDNRALLGPMSLTPTINVLLRPEEEHGASREDDVIPPMCCRYGEVCHAGGRKRLLIAYGEYDRLAAAGTACVDVGITVKGGRDAVRVPHAIGEVFTATRMDLKGRRNRREWWRHDDLVGLGSKRKKAAEVQAPEGLSSLALGHAEAGRHRRYERRPPADDGAVIHELSDLIISGHGALDAARQ